MGRICEARVKGVGERRYAPQCCEGAIGGRAATLMREGVLGGRRNVPLQKSEGVFGERRYAPRLVFLPFGLAEG